MAAEQGEFQLNVEPADKIIFKGNNLPVKGARAELKITNPTKERQVFKIKCTSNDLFRIRPPVGALEPDVSVNVQLNFHYQQGHLEVPDDNKHYFAIYHTKDADGKKTPRQVLTEHEDLALKRVFVVFQNEKDDKPEDEHKDAEKKDENKEENKKEE